TYGQRVGKGCGGDIGIEAPGELAQMLALMLAPVSLAIGAKLALPCAVEVAHLHLHLAGAPMAVALDLVAQAKGRSCGKAQYQPPGHDLLIVQGQAQMLHALAIPGAPEDGALLAHSMGLMESGRSNRWSCAPEDRDGTGPRPSADRSG